MARTKQNVRKKKQNSQEMKNLLRKKKQENKQRKKPVEQRRARLLEAAYKRHNIQNGAIVVVISLSITCLNSRLIDNYLAGYGILPLTGGITPIQGTEVGPDGYSYIFELKCIRHLLRACPQGQSVTVLTKSDALYNFLNNFPSPSNKYQNVTFPLESEARAIVMERNLLINSKLHVKKTGHESEYFKRALNIASMEQHRYRRLHRNEINTAPRRSRRNKRTTDQDSSQNRQVDQMVEVQNQIQQQMRQAMMMNSNNNNDNNNNNNISNPVIPTMPFLHQLPYSLQSTQVNPFLAHLDNVNRNHGISNSNTNARLQTEMHRLNMPSSSQAQSNSTVVHHSQPVHTYQPSVPLHLSPQSQSLSLPSYRQVGTSVGNDIGQVYGASTGGLNYYHTTHQQQQQQQQQQQPHVHTTARGTVAGSSSSIYSMMSPQVVTTTNTPVAAVAYNGNNDSGRVFRGNSNMNGDGGRDDDGVSGNFRLVGTGNNDYDNDDNDEEEVFVDALDDRNSTGNGQESQVGAISTVKAWVSSVFGRFGNY